jgi:hypothetical protein
MLFRRRVHLDVDGLATLDSAGALQIAENLLVISWLSASRERGITTGRNHSIFLFRLGFEDIILSELTGYKVTNCGGQTCKSGR